MTDIQRRIEGQLELPGINIIPNRVGDADRKRTAHHIRDMESRGYMSSEEAATRIAHAANAQTQNDLRQLTHDIPGPVDHRGYFAKWDWEKAEYWLPTLLGTMFMSLSSTIAPGLILASINKFHTAEGITVFTLLCILGVIGFFASLILMVIKGSE
jgi:DUF1707 SHOCT-like domain